MESNKRKVLALYVYDTQHELVETTTKLIQEKGVKIDAICVSSFRFFKTTDILWPWIEYVASFLINTLHLPKAQGFFTSFFSKKVFRRIIDKYDFIDFQSFPSSQTELAEYCISAGKEYMISFWGSDALRADEDELMRKKKSLDGAKYIKLNKQIAEIITNFYKERYGVDYSMKYKGAIDGVTNGNKDIFLLDGLTESDIEQNKALFSAGTGKLIVTIGYNGILQQHQDKILRLLSTLSDEIKKRVHIVLPMTYGASSEHLINVRKIAFESGMTYTILDHFLTNKEVCVLRKITNVFVMLQDSDGFAGSVRSHVYCQNVSLIGDWLDYPIEKAGIFYLKVNWDNLIEIFVDVVLNYEDYHNKSLPNKEKMKPFVTWNQYVDYTSNLYN